jgi:hypothetical protein
MAQVLTCVVVVATGAEVEKPDVVAVPATEFALVETKSEKGPQTSPPRKNPAALPREETNP